MSTRIFHYYAGAKRPAHFDIEPCRFCESEAVRLASQPAFAFVWCGECNAQGPRTSRLSGIVKTQTTRQRDKEAVRLWNAAAKG